MLSEAVSSRIHPHAERLLNRLGRSRRSFQRNLLNVLSYIHSRNNHAIAFGYAVSDLDPPADGFPRSDRNPLSRPGTRLRAKQREQRFGRQRRTRRKRQHVLDLFQLDGRSSSRACRKIRRRMLDRDRHIIHIDFRDAPMQRFVANIDDRSHPKSQISRSRPDFNFRRRMNHAVSIDLAYNAPPFDCIDQDRID